MRRLSVVAMLAGSILLAACPRNGDREVAPDTVVLAPPDDPAALPHAAQTVPLNPVEGVQISAEAVVLPIGIQSQITVHVRDAPPNTPLPAHVHTRTCADPGPLAADLEPVLTDAAGLGTSRTAVDIPPDLIINGNHILILRRGSPDGPVLACGQIPPHPVLHEGAAPGDGS
jgi:hypothetical protein